jgi:hypothetical protein
MLVRTSDCTVSDEEVVGRRGKGIWREEQRKGIDRHFASVYSVVIHTRRWAGALERCFVRVFCSLFSFVPVCTIPLSRAPRRSITVIRILPVHS